MFYFYPVSSRFRTRPRHSATTPGGRSSGTSRSTGCLPVVRAGACQKKHNRDGDTGDVSIPPKSSVTDFLPAGLPGLSALILEIDVVADAGREKLEKRSAVGAGGPDGGTRACSYSSDGVVVRFVSTESAGAVHQEIVGHKFAAAGAAPRVPARPLGHTDPDTLHL